MPRPTMPPTPDLAADQEVDLQSSTNDPDMETIPTSNSTTPQAHVSPSKKRSSGSDAKFSLPPPPSRPRRIIQMKPATQPKRDPKPSLTPANSKGSSNGSVSGASTSPHAGRKGPNPSTAAGKKMARKTAHSVSQSWRPNEVSGCANRSRSLNVDVDQR